MTIWLLLLIPCICNDFCRTDSEIFEDAVELQQFFIRIRDELCKNGEILMTPALSYTSKHLHSDVEKEKKSKLPKEMEEDKLKREEEKKGTLLYPSVTHSVAIELKLILCPFFVKGDLGYET